MPQYLSPQSRPTEESFELRFERSIQLLRGALTELFVALGLDPESPQDVSRTLGINKNLAWKASKVIGSTSGAAALPHVPGPSGLAILLKACAKAGAPESARTAVNEAVVDFDAMTELHAGDRATLELMVGSMLPDKAHFDRLEASRKSVYQGNGAIWGIQARVRLGTQIVVPSATAEGMIDVAVVSGLIGLRRLRAVEGWPLVQSRSHVGGEPLPDEVAIEPSEPGEPPYLREFCSRPLPPTRGVPVENGTVFELCDGPVGNTAASDAIFGWIRRAFAPIHAGAADAFGEHFVMTNTPVERLLFDLLVHRDLPFELPPKARLYSLMQGSPAFPLANDERRRLPLDEAPQDLGEGPPVLATPHFPRYPDVIRTACRALGHSLEELRGWRLALTYPPIPTLPTLSYGKPSRER